MAARTRRTRRGDPHVHGEGDKTRRETRILPLQALLDDDRGAGGRGIARARRHDPALACGPPGGPGGPVVRAAAKPPYPAGDELVELDRTAANRVECVGRDPAGGSGDDGAEVGLLDQRLKVDAVDDGIDVHLREQLVQVDPVQHGIQINLVQQLIHVYRRDHKLDRALRDGLGQRLAARDEPTINRAPSSKLIHNISIAGRGEPGSPRKGEPPRPCSGSAA